MKRGQTWYKRDPIAFMDGVEGLGPELIGAYAYLLDLIYARGGESKRDDRSLAGRLGCSTRKAKALTDALIERGKLEFHDGFVTNSRAKSELKKSREVSERRANAGRTGGENKPVCNKNNNLTQAKPEQCAPIDKIREEKIKNPPISPQEGGGVGIMEKGEKLLGLIGINFNDPSWFGDFSIISRWEGDGIDFDLDILPAIQQSVAKSKTGKKPRSLKYYDRPVRDWHSRRKPDSGLVDHYVAKHGSAQWKAWRAYRVQNGETVKAMDAQESWSVPTEWPPGTPAPENVTCH